MKSFDDESIDFIFSDLPFGTTACRWDTVIPYNDLWCHCKRIIKKHRAIAFFAMQPFASMLIVSNVDWFKYCWYWRMGRPTGHMVAKLRPFKDIVEVCVFSEGTVANGSQRNMPYYPQGLRRVDVINVRPKHYITGSAVSTGRANNPLRRVISHTGYPRQVIDFKSVHNVGLLHPTQKPVDLLEYIIKTYTQPGDTVLDITMGSGSTGEACANTDRMFKGIEMDSDYYCIAEHRVYDAYRRPVPESEYVYPLEA